MFGARGLGYYRSGMSEDDVGVVAANCIPAGLDAPTRAMASPSPSGTNPRFMTVAGHQALANMTLTWLQYGHDHDNLQWVHKVETATDMALKNMIII